MDDVANAKLRCILSRLSPAADKAESYEFSDMKTKTDQITLTITNTRRYDLYDRGRQLKKETRIWRIPQNG